ncbi:uncharacterized protein LOC117398065 [Acipenser ruthenus]|uniref:uncharacterized protein LOC117398065 n=1 Tax=Acipenser ruthenus TaxID=7906 RepID=UPI00145B2B58|nr:uncharacterized protein LOC117398065 [Acipenser ruthenus]
MASTASWLREFWASQLGPCLIEEAQAAYQAMSDLNAASYNLVKQAILRRLNITAETHRTKTNVQMGETIVVEQFCHVVGADTQAWIRRHNPDTLEGAVKLAEDYEDSLESSNVFRVKRHRDRPYICNMDCHARIAFMLCGFSVLALEVESSITLTQSDSVLKKPGESVRLSCKISGYAIDEHHEHWIRKQPLGKGFEWLASYRTESFSNHHSPAIQGRFTASADIPSSTCFLQMNSLRVEDTGVYYCARESQ